MNACHITEITNLSKRQKEILEEMCKGMTPNFGVTLQGNRLTVRWYHKGELVEVHMVILNILDDKEYRTCTSDKPRNER
jgi:hypothetical protein